jgi:endonuclease/exonuclease/phosphatase family metal-dependent hydrolase
MFPLRLCILGAWLVLALHPATAENGPWLEVPFTSQSPIRPASPPPRPADTLRIASWNIEWFPAGQRRGAPEPTNLQTAAVAALINEIKPDILAVQEIRNLPALQTLNRNLGLWPFSHLAASWFYQLNTSGTPPPERIEQQCGLLSRHPWEETWEIDFTPLTEKPRPPRGWLAARFRIHAATFTLYTGHLKSDFGATTPEQAATNSLQRAAAIRHLAHDLERRGLDPYRDRILLVGDFNADIATADRSRETLFDDLERLGFRSALQPARRAEAITVPAREGVPDVPDLTLDYIFLSSAWGPPPPIQILAKGASKKKDVYGGDRPGLASDHYPIFVDLPIPLR